MATFSLNDFQVEELMVEVITGKRLFSPQSSDGIFAVKFPSVEIRDRSRIIYQKACLQLQKEGLPSKGQMLLTLKKTGAFPRSYFMDVQSLKNRIKENESAIEMSTSKAQIAQLNVESEQLGKRLLELQRIEDSLLDNTIEMKAEDVRVNYLVSRCTLCGEELDDLYWSTYDEFVKSTERVFILEAKRNFLNMSIGLPPQAIRALARSSEWRNRWKAAQKTGSSVFPGDSSTWDRNKVLLCYWSDFYDSILGYSTPPAEEVLNDDDALFSWIRDVNRINKAEANKKTPNKGGVTKQVNTPYKVRPKAEKISKI